MKIITKDFVEGGMIPSEFTCDGGGKMFDLKVSELPEGTKCLAMIIDDIDAPKGVFTHFLAWNIPVAESVVNCEELLSSSVVGSNSANQTSYTPPCPPSGRHRYYVRFYALSEGLDLSAGANRQQLEQAMQNKVLKEDQIMGIYSRS